MNTEATMTLPERDHEHERMISIVFDLPFQQARLVSLLARGGVPTTQQVQEYLESKTEPKVIATHARSKLKELGMDIKSKAHVGYWMEPKDRDGVAEALKKYLEGH